MNRRKATTLTAAAATVAELTVGMVPAGGVPAPPHALETVAGFLLVILFAALTVVAARYYLSCRNRTIPVREGATS